MIAHPLSPGLDLITDTYYFILFPLMIIEGPGVMIVAGFLVSRGYYGFIDVYVAALIAALCGDFLHYAAGRWWRRSLLFRWEHYIGITPKVIERAERLFASHSGKVLIANKWSFAFTSVGLVAAGASEVPLPKFFFYNLIGELPKSLLLISIGYYLGDAYTKANKYLNYSATVIAVIVVVAGGAYLISRHIDKRFKA